MSSESAATSFKVVLLGEGAVGKTSLVLRYVQDRFSEQHVTTLQASFLSRRLQLSGRRVQLAIWDTAGQERFHALGPIYYRDAHGALLVYDITDADSFRQVQSWARELRRMLGPDVCLAIAANKQDLSSRGAVPLATALQYADSVQAKHCQVSAKTGVGVEEAFLHLTQQMLVVRDAAAAGTTPSRRANRVVVSDETPPQEARGCCR